MSLEDFATELEFDDLGTIRKWLLYQKYLIPWFKTVNHEDTCPLGEKCPFKMAVVENVEKRQSVWSSIGSYIRGIRIKMGITNA